MRRAPVRRTSMASSAPSNGPISIWASAQWRLVYFSSSRSSLSRALGWRRQSSSIFRGIISFTDGFLARRPRFCSATRTAGHGAILRTRGGFGSAIEQAVVHTGIANDFEIRRVARLAQHRSGIAADRLRLTRFKQVVIVQNETVGLLRDAAEIIGHLPVILAAVLEVELEGAHGKRMETDHAGFLFDGGIGEREP